MDYQKHYETLITRAKERGTRKRNLSYHTEKHRILPGCLGGKYTKENVALLTPEEHHVAHQLLIKMYSNSDSKTYYKIVHSWNQMSQGRSNNKRYGWLKRRYQQECKKRVGSNNPNYGRSWYHNPETLENGTFVPGTEPQGWIRGRKPNKQCIECNKDTGSKEAKYCKHCRRHCRRHLVGRKPNKQCIECNKDTGSKEAKYCKHCRDNVRKRSFKKKFTSCLDGREFEFLDLYKKLGSKRKALKTMGKDAAGSYLKWANLTIKNHLEGQST